MLLCLTGFTVILTVRTPGMIRLMTLFSSLIGYVLINLPAVFVNLKYLGFLLFCFEIHGVSWFSLNMSPSL
jgi:hypothetical protein